MRRERDDALTMSYAAFADPHEAAAAALDCREKGHVVSDVFGPFPIHGIDRALGLGPSRMTWVCFAFGLTGLLVALWLQYWTSATDWPLNVGGKPFDSLPAFVPVAFELTVLFAGLGTVAVLFLRSGLRPGRKSRAPNAAVTDDEFVVAVRRTAGAPRLEDIWTRHGAARSWEEVAA